MIPTVFWRWLALAALIVILWAGFRPDPIPQYTHDFDKWTHAVGFGVLTLLSLLAVPRRLGWLVIVSMVVLGAAIEVGQDWLLPRRTFDWADFAMDAVGVGLGLAVYVLCLIGRKYIKGI
ncbi:VanZ family protein [Pseudomaricurvus sp. HS19]|uniref:VanZ family protein n=1 Tax=Pseudomaricurvus sp. HS19 TaxID=2692626 RepID=UPI00136AD104|nr:VanZ family protein [Pseudomaricurvus sp. HS19]MYM65119.1 hypothetical protein [Pseudomaricurvus sp. HS19]